MKILSNKIFTVKERLNYTFSPWVLTKSRNWSCSFQIEQSSPFTIMFLAILVLTLILPSKNTDMAKEHLCDSANLENDINMSTNQKI